MHGSGLPCAANVVCQGEVDVVLDLPVACLTAHLLPDFNDLRYTSSPSWMPLGF